MTQVLSSSPPSLSLPAFATFSLEESLLLSSTSGRVGDRDAHSPQSGVHSTSNTWSSETASPLTASTSLAGSTAMSSTTADNTADGATNGIRQQEQQPQMYVSNASTSSPLTIAARPSSSNNSASSSRSGTPVNGGSSSTSQHRPHHHLHAQHVSSSSQRAPSPSPSSSYASLSSSASSPSSHPVSQTPQQYSGVPNIAPSPSPTHFSQQHLNHNHHLNDANPAAMQAAMMQAAYQQQQQHFQNQMNAMLAAGYSQHQLVQHFQQHPQYLPHSSSVVPSAAIGGHHDPRRRAPSLPNTPNGGGLIQSAGYFPPASTTQQQHQHHHQQHYQALPQASFQQQYCHPQFAPHHQHYPSSGQHISQQHHHHQPQYSPYASPPPIPPAMRGSPVSSLHGSPGRERAPTAPSSLHSPMSSAASSPSSGISRTAPTAVAMPPFVQPPRPNSPGGIADLARRRAESQPNDHRVPLAPTTGTQPQHLPSHRQRTGSTSSESRKPVFVSSPQSSHARPVPPPQLHNKGSADLSGPPLPRIRTDSGISYTSSQSSTSASGVQNADGRAASPASITSDRAPTPTQALHSQLAGSSTTASSGRTTPIAPSAGVSALAPAARQQSLGLQPSIKLTNGASQTACNHAAGGAGIIRKASPLSQQSTYSDGHRSVTPTQAAASRLASGESVDSDEEREEIVSQQPEQRAPSKHRATLSNASSTMSSSPQTPSSGKSGSSFLRNKLRKAMSLSELNNSSSTLSSGDASSSSKQLGRTSLTSNSSSSDTSHSTAEPRTPPNGAAPAILRGPASASASNLHSVTGAPDEHGMQHGKAAPMHNGSLPSNAGRRFGILNPKMNSSTDNISISSTVSSASMMLRKMGNFGKLARKSSVRSLSNLFHRDKQDREDNEGDGNSIGPNGRKITSDAVSEFGVPGAAMVSSKDRKKSQVADPSVAHVTVELERGEAAAGLSGKAGMTPAEALVRKHQERERMQKLQQEEEEKARTARSRTASSSSSVVEHGGVSSGKSKNQQDLPSPRSKLLEKEKERLKNQNAGKKSLAKKFSFGAFSRSTSSSSLRQEALHAAASSSTSNQHQQESEDKASPRSSSSSSSANASPIFDSSATSSTSPSPVILQHELEAKQFSKPIDIDFRPSLDSVQLDTWRNGPAAVSGISMHPLESGLEIEHREDENDEGFDDRTPRQSMELIGDQSLASSSSEISNHTGNYSDWDGEPPNTTSFFDDDTASFKDESDHTARSNVSSNIRQPFYLQQDPEDYSSDSGVDGNGRNGQAIPRRPPPHARPTKGILKNARSYSQEQLRGPQPPFASRPRASSYDAPHQMMPPNQPGKVATLAQYIPTGDELDGVASHPAGASRLDTRLSSPTEIDYNNNNKENLSPSSTGSFSPGTSPYNHPNTSEPILSNMKSIHMTTRSVTTGPKMKRNISFATNLSVHTTWSGTTYDRRGDPATCNRLTPQLAQAIKEELNAFKMEEMAVHHLSRNYTHFFV